jgi:phenylpropionate dioxygenase-like ring-hydroxylating dioxygenase large terminal subunit
MTYVRDCWYVVGWSHEIPRELSTARVMDEDIVLYRTESGTPVALEDQCPHKRLPLSMGKLKGDAVQCGYHGMTFGANGRCVRIPGQDNLPDSARVRTYPLHEANGIVWIWMGDPARADTSTVFDLPEIHQEGWAPHFGDGLYIAANYVHLADNLCDPSHVAYVHPTTLGNPESEDVPVEVERSGRTVITSRWIRDAPPIGFFKAFGDFKGHVDRWHYYYFHAPSTAVIDFGSTDAALNASEDERHLGVRLFAIHFLTPVSQTETIDHWMHVRNIGIDDATMGDRMNEQFRIAFDEDKVILEAIQKREEKPLGRRPVRLAIDKGPNFLKKIIAEMADEERPGKAAAE